MDRASDESIRILIVDDNTQNLHILGTIFKKENYNVHIAKNGVQAIRIAENVRPDIILLDVMMPEMNGFEACKRLKENTITQDIPIIFITAMTDAESIIKGFATGAVDYVTKPFNTVELTARVKTHLELTRSRKEMKKLTLMQEQMLIQQSKMATMGEMIALIAHQWRQPLHAISLFVHDLKDAFNFGELNKEYIELSAKRIGDQIHYMSDTIEDFRNFFTPGKEKITFGVNTAIRKTLSLVNKQLKKSGIKVSLYCNYETVAKKHPEDYLPEVCICEPDIPVIGHPNEFKQTVLNILNNSRDAIEERIKKGLLKNNEKGEVTIVLSKKNNIILIEINDNGGGIPDNAIDNIFDPYFTTKEYGGTGIGLYISKIIIERNMKGKLYAKNQDNGVCFSIELPICT